MSATLDQLLNQLARGQLTTEAARTQLENFARASAEAVPALIARVQSEVAAGRLSHDAARALLQTLEARAEHTAMLGGRTQVHADATLVRPAAGSTEATAAMNPDRTVRMPPKPQPDATLVTPAPSAPAIDDDRTQQRAAPTMVEPTQQMPPRATPAPAATVAKTLVTPQSPEADATVRTLRSDPDATVRTLQPEVGNTQQAAAYTATLRAPPPAHSPDRTQPIANRLVGSLAEAGEGHHGPLQPGSVIKQRFILDTQIGKGGMGLVFAAIDRRKEEAKDPNPRVALKVLNTDFQRHPQSFIALQREARKAQTLAHPNVVTVFDFDRDGDAVYMTMELLKGRTLDSIVREARGKGVSREVALPIIRGIAEGLAYAHRKGIVHSDLKPGNVFIVEDGTPKILDFGIARAVPSSVNEDNKDVFDAGSLGAYTEAYATDEMIDGTDPHPADDMYALGIIGYELLTGFHPYQRHSAPGARKLGLKPAPLKGLKRKEARALERCLSFDRKDRPKDAGEFLKLFRGVTKLQKATLAATAVLAMVAGYLWYQNYVETSPAIPFAQLPAEVQSEFTASMKEGDVAWDFYRKENEPAYLSSAIEFYAKAYALHPRNREAVSALNRAADAMLSLAADEPDRRREIAEYLQASSDHYKKYAPVVDAAK